MKKILSILLSLMLVCQLAACAGEAAQQSEGTAPVASEAGQQPETAPAAPEAGQQPETPSSAAENAPAFELNTKIDVCIFNRPYGFQENRAWVYNQSGTYLIDPAGEIILAIPKDLDTAYTWQTLSPIWNGAGYLEGKNMESGWPAVLFIDADGNELSRFESSETERYAVIGRSEEHFLVRCIRQTTETQLDVYLLSLNLDGTLAGAPRQILTAEARLAYMDMYEIEADYMGEEIFLVGLNTVMDGHGFYNSANNTFQYTPSREYAFGGMFYNGSTMVNDVDSSPAKGFLASPEDFQSENVNFILTQGAVIEGKNEDTGWLTQYGPWLVDNYSVIYDQQGNQITLPEALAGSSTKPYLDGYLFIENADFFSVLGPDGELLYAPIRKQDYKPDYTYYDLPVKSCGYLWARNYETNTYGIVDHTGSFHSISEDLSALPDLEQLNLMGFGEGYILAAETDLGLERQTGGYAIRSLDGKQIVRELSKTADTKVLEVSAPVLSLDPASAQRVGVSGAQAEEHDVTASSEVQAMDTDGIIYAQSFENVLLFDKDGVTIAMTEPGVIEFANDNPDNQKAILGAISAQLDGVKLDSTILENTTLAVGERVTFAWDYDSRGFSPSFSEMLVEYASGLAQLPLQELRLQFSLKIGSQSDSVEYTRAVRLTSYSEDSLKALRGDVIGEYSLEDGGEPAIRLYRLQDDNFFAYAIENISDQLIFTLWGDHSFSWSANGQPMPSIIRSLDQRLELTPGAIQLVQLQGSAQDIRRELELPNAEPIELTLCIYTTTGSLQAMVERIE